MTTHKSSATPLELHADAAVLCATAWTYPSDTEVRQGAIMACGLVGIDYIETVAANVDALAGSDSQTALHAARWLIVDHLLQRMAALVKGGTLPRYGTLCTGEPVVDGLGFGDRNYQNPYDQESDA